LESHTNRKQYTCLHTTPIELFPCGSEIEAFACINGIEIISLQARHKRGKGKCRACRRIDAQRWREGKVPVFVDGEVTLRAAEGKDDGRMGREGKGNGLGRERDGKGEKQRGGDEWDGVLLSPTRFGGFEDLELS
jgi:hypothetical protein